MTYGFCTFFGLRAFLPTYPTRNTKETKYNFRNHLILNKLSKLGKCQLATKSPVRIVFFFLTNELSFKTLTFKTLTVTSKTQTYAPETKHCEPFTYKN